MTEVKTRVLSSILLIPLALVALYLGGLPLAVALSVIATWGTYEYIVMMRKADINISKYWILISLAMYVGMTFSTGLDMVFIWLCLLGIFVEGLLFWDERKSIPRGLATLFGIVYTSIFPALIARVGMQYKMKKILLALILMIWIVDSVAYFVGMKFGKKRNITAISPKKSMEGFLAGAVAPWLIVLILYVSKLNILPFSLMALIAVAAGVFGQLGDLAESMLKRYCETKDSSNLIPGHGGILDRSDSILLAGSFLYCALVILEKM